MGVGIHREARPVCCTEEGNGSGVGELYRIRTWSPTWKEKGQLDWHRRSTACPGVQLAQQILIVSTQSCSATLESNKHFSLSSWGALALWTRSNNQKGDQMRWNLFFFLLTTAVPFNVDLLVNNYFNRRVKVGAFFLKFASTGSLLFYAQVTEEGIQDHLATGTKGTRIDMESN